MGVPVRTVHTRTERALAELKARLDHSFGRRDAWCGALARLAGGGLALPLGLSTLGGLAMGTAIKWGGAAALLVAGGFLVQSRWSAPGTPASPPARVVEEAGLPAALAEPLLAEQASGGSAPRTAVDFTAPGDAAAAAAVPAAELETFAGRVIDDQGRPVEGVLVVFESPADPLGQHLPPGELAGRSGLSEADGTFHLLVQDGGGSLSVRDERWASINTPALGWMPPPEPPVLIVGPKRVYAGMVVGADGAPVADVDVIVQPPAAVAQLLPVEAVREDPAAVATSDGEGRFRFDAVGYAPGVELVARSFVYQSEPQALPPADALDLVVTVVRRLGDGVLAGRVVDARGEGVPGAYVSAGSMALQADGQGSFTLDLHAMEEMGAGEIVAVHAGFLPARRALAGLSTAERQSLVLELGAEPLSIAGRLVDAGGAPVADGFVWSFESTFFGYVPTQVQGDAFFALSATAEGLAAGQPAGAFDLGDATDAGGGFELRGLLPRSYALWAVDLRTLSTAGPLAVDAGDRDVVLRLPGEERAGPVGGRVTNLAGEPLAGVHVAAYRRVESAAGMPQDPPGDRAARATTDAEGGFRFARLALDGCHLVLRSPDGPVVEVELAREERPAELVLAVPEVRHVRIVLESDPELANLFSFEDAGGANLMTTSMAGSVRMSANMHVFLDGSSGLVATDERATTLVLFMEGLEVRRVPLELKRGSVAELRL